MTIESYPTWTVVGDTSLLWETWGNESVVFQPASGQTHFLNAVAALALRQLEDTPCNAPDLSRRLANRMGCAFDEAFAQQVEALLAQFNRLGLITDQNRQPSCP